MAYKLHFPKVEGEKVLLAASLGGRNYRMKQKGAAPRGSNGGWLLALAIGLSAMP